MRVCLRLPYFLYQRMGIVIGRPRSGTITRGTHLGLCVQTVQAGSIFYLAGSVVLHEKVQNA